MRREMFLKYSACGDGVSAAVGPILGTDRLGCIPVDKQRYRNETTANERCLGRHRGRRFSSTLRLCCIDAFLYFGGVNAQFYPEFASASLLQFYAYNLTL